jgi:hypothetical protein
MLDSWLIKTVVQWLVVTTLAGWTVNCQWSPENSSSYRVYLQTQDAFDQTASDFMQGETANLIVSVENTGQSPLTFRSDSAQRFEFTVQTPGGRELWRWSEANDVFFSQVVSEFSISPGQIISWSVDWPLEETDGTPVPIGQYVVTGEIFGAGKDERSLRVL